MKKWIFIGASLFSVLSLTAFTSSPKTLQIATIIQEEGITAIINKNTTKKELEDLKSFLAENGIELSIKNLAYNDNNEITSLSITIKKGNDKSKYSSSSHIAISEIKLGYKNNSLFITNTAGSNIASWNNQSHFTFPKVHIDSLLKKHNLAFSYDFGQELDSLNINRFNLEQLKNQLLDSFNFDMDENGHFSINGRNFAHPFQQQSKINKYNFIDNPDIDKLIIIDGKDADFETLDQLAKSDQLSEVDFLKPKTAISIYGAKAKDGAIIATTK